MTQQQSPTTTQTLTSEQILNPQPEPVYLSTGQPVVIKPGAVKHPDHPNLQGHWLDNQPALVLAHPMYSNLVTIELWGGLFMGERLPVHRRHLHLWDHRLTNPDGSTPDRDIKFWKGVHDLEQRQRIIRMS